MMKRVWGMMLAGSLMAVSTGCVGMEELAGDQSQDVKAQVPKLNLSHIACDENGGVVAHFVLLFWGTTEPGTISGTYSNGTTTLPFGPTAAYKTSGNVWHYNVYLPSGSIDITSATIDGTGIQLHNPDEYAGDYQCGGQPPACAGNGTQAGLVCTDHPLTNPGDECAAFGLLPLGKDDGLTGLTFTATMDAYVALVKSGTHPCGGGNSAYQVYVNVHAGDTLTTPADQNISHVTYCACPD